VPAQDRAWGAALVLMIVTFVATVAARAVANQFAVKR
jgi:ABC-type phosphate transport system permease subunit